MRSSLVTFLVIIGSFVAVASFYPRLFPRALPVGEFSVHQTPRAVPAFSFLDVAGEQMDLAQFSGSYLFVNVWATWCEPCREEMPALDRMARKLKQENIRFLPISIDATGRGSVERFYKRHDLRDLPVYVDADQNIMRALDVFGIPTTVLIGPGGKEIGRMVGPAQWDRPESIQNLKDIMG